MGQEGLRFVVFGATGAVGAATVRALLGNAGQELAHPIQAVFTVGRRPLDVAADPRLHQLVLPTLDDMDKDQDTIKQLQGSVDIAIIALGTTRSAAGDAAAFKKVDVEYVAAAARLSKASGVRSLGLVSAQGANANIWANDMKLFHGLLYARSKGEAEALVLAEKFGYTAIARPGLMNRGTAARLGEKMGAWILPSVPAEQVARQLIRATIRGLDGGVEVGGRVDVIEMRDLKAPVA